MTGLELLKNALAILGKDTAETTDYETSALIHINSILAELYDINNGILAAAEETELTSIPTLALEAGEDLSDIDMSTDTGYADMLIRNVMPWGLARMIGLSENFANIGYVANTYEENKLKATIYNEVDITDVYSDSDEDEES